jgi:hypothetical protein
MNTSYRNLLLETCTLKHYKNVWGQKVIHVYTRLARVCVGGETILIT